MDTNETLRAVGLCDFLKLELPPRELILEPWLHTQGLAMIYAPRGVGKTHVSLGIAYAVATGQRFLQWQAPKPRGVLFIDGEMPANILQERLGAIAQGAQIGSHIPLKILTPDLQQHGIPDLATLKGQQAINTQITEDIDLIILDNLSTLVRSGAENQAESWQPIQTWVLQLRSLGKSVLFIHHSGKSGQQRGTSRREDVLDTVIALRRPGEYSPKDGAAFKVEFEKARSIYGDEVAPFKARLMTAPDGKQYWDIETSENQNLQKVAHLLNQGHKQKDIAIELNLDKSWVSRLASQAKAEGLVQPQQNLQLVT